ncbi:hypothetical protein HDU87_005381 [Geranomyces variabilis]|uniref:Ras-GEF domain-containing protein n=1 Tax=Geranomyces variabilis TaxID=109894 RepID=A0AAD5XPC4_9FUNG|nr:hypothetical protein HDU87_005381 [Geranomyces variabilis]
MSAIDVAIASADKHLGQLDLKAAFDAYLAALALISSHFSTDTVFAPEDEQNATETTNASASHVANKRFKNSVAVIPDDVERLFGLAHLCLTEVEDIMFGTVSIDDLEPFHDSDEESDGDEDEEMNLGPTGTVAAHSSEPLATVLENQLFSNAVSGTYKAEGSPAVKTESSPLVLPQSKPPKAVDFREHRLSRAHTIRSLKRSGTWNSLRNSGLSGSSSLRPISVASLEEDCTALSPLSSSWLLETSRAESPEPKPAVASNEVQQHQEAPGPRNPRTSGESLIWHFPSVPKRGAKAPPPDLPKPSSCPPSTTPQEQPSAAPPLPSQDASPPRPPPPYRMLCSQPEQAVSLNQSNVPSLPRTPRQYMFTDYLPIIPASPLIHQHRYITEQYNAAGAQLQQLEQAQHTGRAGAATAGVLSQVRRLVETTGLAKRKLAQLSGLIAEWDCKTLSQVGTTELAGGVVCFDVDMFRALTPPDLVTHALSNGATVPDTIKRVQDFSFFLHRVVQATVVDCNLPVDRASAIVRWILVAQALVVRRDLHAAHAVCSALASPPIAGLKATWKLVSKKYRGIYANIPRPADDDGQGDGWRKYRRDFLDGLPKPCVPALDALLRQPDAGDAVRMLEACKQGEEDWDRDVGSAGNPSNGCIGPMHWLVTRRWMSAEQVERISRELEPAAPAGKAKRKPQSSRESSKGSKRDEASDEALKSRFNKLGFR